MPSSSAKAAAPLFGDEKVGKAHARLGLSTGHLNQRAVGIENDRCFDALAIEAHDAERRISEHRVINARSRLPRLARNRSLLHRRTARSLLGSARDIDDRTRQRLGALARPHGDQGRRRLHAIAGAEHHFRPLARHAAHITLHQLEAFGAHDVFKAQRVVAIGQAQHLAQCLVDIDHASIAAGREEPNRCVFHIKRARIDRAAAGNRRTSLDTAQTPQRPRFAQWRNARLELHRRVTVAEEQRGQHLRLCNAQLHRLGQAVDWRRHAGVGREQAIHRRRMRAVAGHMRKLRDLEIASVRRHGRAAAIRDQRRLRQSLKPHMSFGRLRSRLRRAAFWEHAELPPSPTHHPQHQHERHCAQSDHQHRACRPDRLAPGQSHARRAACNRQSGPETELDVIEALPGHGGRGLDRFVDERIVRVRHGRVSGLRYASIGVIRARSGLAPESMLMV